MEVEGLAFDGHRVGMHQKLFKQTLDAFNFREHHLGRFRFHPGILQVTFQQLEHALDSSQRILDFMGQG